MIAIISYSLKFEIGEISSLRLFGNKLLAKDILLDNISLLDNQIIVLNCNACHTKGPLHIENKRITLCTMQEKFL